MNIKKPLVAGALIWSCLFTASSGFAQGSLTPPGPPAPTMVTLSQLGAAISQAEPRTIVNPTNTRGDSNNAYIISQPGSYYLTTNVNTTSTQNAVEITTNNVTLDLSGFSLQSDVASNSNDGIYIPNAVNNVTVRNGSISGWAIGVNADTTSAGLVFELLNVSGNSEYGILATNATCVARNCSFLNNGTAVSLNGLVTGCIANNNGEGIICPSFGTIAACTADNNFGPGIDIFSGTVTGCTVENNSASGIVLYAGTVSGCTAVDNGVYGIYLSPGTASGCYVSGSFYSGIYVNGNGSEVLGNTCTGNNSSGSGGDGGIFISASNSRIEDNQITGSGNAGIAVTMGSSNNFVIKNTVYGNGANDYIAPAGNAFGPTITNSGTISTTSPWANFAF